MKQQALILQIEMYSPWPTQFLEQHEQEFSFQNLCSSHIWIVRILVVGGGGVGCSPLTQTSYKRTDSDFSCVSDF